MSLYKQTHANFAIFVLLGITLASTLGYAYQIKYYGKVDPVNIISYNIPNKYFNGITAVSFFSRTNPSYLAYYHYGGLIEMYGVTNKEILIHELAHNCQVKLKDSSYQVANHLGHFYHCEEEITNASL